MNGRQSPLRICLAASGGGHLRQLIELSAAWSDYDHFFVTEDTPLGRSLRSPTHFVPHFALGQGRLGHPIKMLMSAFANMVRSAQVVLSKRPNVIVSTGAGSAFFVVLFARMIGARVVLIETFARFNSLSAFGKLAGPLAHHRIVQSAALTRFWPNAKVFDPLRVAQPPITEKEPLLFVTVGATLPFPKLVEAVAALKAEGAISEDVIIQRGVGAAAPSGVDSFETAPFGDVIEILRRARLVVCHGGTGSLITSLREGCHVIAMPRQFDAGEHYDDHQSEIAQAFAARGLIQVAHTKEEISAAIREAGLRAPVKADTDYSLMMNYLIGLLTDELDRRSPRDI